MGSRKCSWSTFLIIDSIGYVCVMWIHFWTLVGESIMCFALLWVVKVCGPYVVTLSNYSLWFKRYYMARLVVKKTCTKKILTMMWWDWTMCSNIPRQHSRFKSEHNWEGLCDRCKWTKIFTLTPSNFFISAWMIIFVISSCYPNEAVPDWIYWPKLCHMKLEVLTMGPYIYILRQ